MSQAYADALSAFHEERKSSIALMKLLSDEKHKSERLAASLAWHQKVLARAVQFDWLTSAVPEDLAQDVLDCMNGALTSPGSEKETKDVCRSCGKPPGQHDDDCINHAGQFGYAANRGGKP